MKEVKKRERRKNLPVSIDNFEVMIKNDFYYFDKTGLIEEICKSGASRILFTRPRRFGKTLNMSMLKYFFDVENAEENAKLFKNLHISQSEYFDRQGQNPVIFITFKNYEKNNWKDGFKAIKSEIGNLFSEFKFLMKNLDKKESRKFENIWLEEEDADWDNALLLLSKYLYEYYGKKAVLLIDEYDKPIMKAHQNGYYDEAVEFFKSFYSSALKGNDYAEIAVMTGILRIAREGIFSGLNNLEVHTVLEEGYNEYFGISENEVITALKYYDLAFELEEVKKWYNGYLFGDTNVYNPWSIINFLKFKKLEEHWVNTSSNDEIMNYLEKADEKIMLDLENLFNGETITKEVFDFVTLKDIDNAMNLFPTVWEESKKYGFFNEDFGINNIWNFFLHSGYLTVAEKIKSNIYKLKIPNEEILDFFKIRFLYRTFGGQLKFLGIGENLVKGNYEKFGKELKELLKNSVSFRDLKEENSYHLFVLGLISVMQEKYYIKSNLESGDRLPDLVLMPKNKEERSFIFEFKHSKTKRNLKNEAKSAMTQINEKNYAKGLEYENYKQIVKIGMSFWKKDLEIMIEEK